MNNLINRDILSNFKNKLIKNLKVFYQLIKLCSKKPTKRQCIVLFSSNGLIALFFVMVCVSHFSDYHKLKNNHPVHFETTNKVVRKPNIKIQIQSPENTRKRDDKKLYAQLNQLEKSSNKQMQALRIQLQIMQSRFSSLASQDDIEKLQKTVSKPNGMLLGKMNNLQNSVQKIVQQTAKKTWVDPTTVQKYFHLVAVQGFSDGMRTIIDVDGNQTTLSKNEICPVCRGWVLQKMSFANQSAVFSKQKNAQTIYVKLRTN